jgi:myo-inositol-1(or 4)-monophosphatase
MSNDASYSKGSLFGGDPMPSSAAIRVRVEQARIIARTAGALLMDLRKRETLVERKGEIDFVTDADRQSEALIVRRITEIFPSDFIWAEEAGNAHGGISGCWTDGFAWIIDPLDGTTNFVHSIPHIAVSLGITYRGEEVGGVVFDPYRDELFEGVKGEGAFLNQQPIEVTRVFELSQSLIGTGFPYDRRKHLPALLQRAERVMMEAHGIRRNGVAALDLCWLACGRFDGFYEEGLKPWDTCAGAVIILEAGGQLSTYAGSPFDILAPEIVASNGRIHQALLRRVVVDVTQRPRYQDPGAGSEGAGE